MKTPSPGMMAAGLIGLTGIILVSIGAPSSRSRTSGAFCGGKAALASGMGLNAL